MATKDKAKKDDAPDAEAVKPPAADAPPPASADAAKAASKRAAAAADPRMVESLLAERRGYVARGKDDRVALVDEQIRHSGGEPPTE